MALARDERVECLTSLDALRALRPEWDRLWESVRDRTPFQSSAWLLAWWEAFGVDAELYVVTIRDRGDRGDRGDQLIGLAPLYRSAQPRQRARELRLLGAGVSDYLDLLASPGEEARVAEALRRTLDADPDWATCDFDRLRPGSPLLGMSTPDTATADRTMQEEPCPVVTLPAPLSPHAMKDLRYYRRRADRIGVSFEEATSDTVQEMLSSLFALHGARWASKGSEGVLAAEHVRTFHRAAAPALFERGLLRMHQLRVQKRIGGVY